MMPTNLEWEDITQFEEIEGYGKSIWKNEDKYYLVLEEGTVASWLVVYGNTLYYVDEEGGIAPQRVVYEFPLELFQLLKSGEKTLTEIAILLVNLLRFRRYSQLLDQKLFIIQQV